jgi:hypothetical protein
MHKKLFPVIELLILGICVLVFNFFQIKYDFIGAEESQNGLVFIAFVNLILMTVLGFIFVAIRTVNIFIKSSGFNKSLKSIKLLSLVFFILLISFFLVIISFGINENNSLVVYLENWSILKRQIVLLFSFSIPVSLYLISVILDLFSKVPLDINLETMEHLIEN